MENLDILLMDLVEYAIQKEFANPLDRGFLRNRLLSLCHLQSMDTDGYRYSEKSLPALLSSLADEGAKRGLLQGDTPHCRDLFTTALLGALTPNPSAVIAAFWQHYNASPRAATDWFYQLSQNIGYIRADRVKEDLKWSIPSPYGRLHITVNLQKPEKDPRDIAAAAKEPPRTYPKCLLCHENEGYSGHLAAPPRQNLRQIPLTLGKETWYFQYSPYVYYNEHCILLADRHTPMGITEKTFQRMLRFITVFPHYFIGSNADLPIVGGSILSHDHMQGGRFSFPMDTAPVKIPLGEQNGIAVGILRWPLSVLRLEGNAPRHLVTLATRILEVWRGYTDADADIFAETNGTPHNTITPIARRKGDAYQLDLVLRNNRTSKEYPEGVFHPHRDLHHIKKENIGLIEVMGLAVLPARLKTELSQMETAILQKTPFSAITGLEKHEKWFLTFKEKYHFTPQNTAPLLKEEVGRVFLRVLEDAGVFPQTEKGLAAFLRFAAAAGLSPTE